MSVPHAQTTADSDSTSPGTERVLLQRQILPVNRDTDVVRLYVDPDPAVLDEDKFVVGHNKAAQELNLAALVCPTLSGRSARLISAHRPTVPIYALSPGRETVRRCGLRWGVQAASMKRYEITEELIAAAARRVVELGWCKPGDRVGITAGLPSGKPGTTSLLQIQEV